MSPTAFCVCVCVYPAVGISIYAEMPSCVFSCQIPPHQLHIRYQGATVWEGQLGGSPVPADAGRVW